MLNLLLHHRSLKNNWYCDVTLNEDNTVSVWSEYHLAVEDQQPKSEIAYWLYSNAAGVYTHIRVGNILHEIRNPRKNYRCGKD